ncbi:MAG TPA: pyrimidine 5'-nucleotidase [Thermohalobaculum sp.]|nr:pyrimidine 5'-nucleotidase [Thermohalobaculum sp.]
MFDHVETWIFDLDNTLYHPSARLFDQINAKMTGFIMRELGVGRAEADRLRQGYWQRHGTTLRGLIEEHRVDAVRFLDEVHEIDLAALAPDADLAEALRRLPGRKIVHTNGARSHAARVLAARGLTGHFDAVYAIEDKALVPKPQRDAYDRIVRLDGFDPARAAMIEDDARNLEVPKALGMATVWVSHRNGAKAPGWVDRRISRLTTFLREFE